MPEAALNYNEAKVRQGKAVCLQAVNYLREAHEMNFYQKLDGFRRLNELNERAATKTIHISLNFDPSERLSDIKLAELANAYMQKIGFGEQPFLIYKHEDAGHPHIHIVSNTIRHDGSRINTHNIGRNQSEKTRKELERIFGLVKAESQKRDNRVNNPFKIEKALYGKLETKQAITNAVAVVFNQYRFTSLPEFNAALRQFNVVADRGKEDGRVYKNHGLMYRILDAGGSKIGVPIKASSIYCQPTLKNLEAKFTSNAAAKEQYKEKIKQALGKGLADAQTMKSFVANLAQQNIYAVLRQNSDGLLYGMTYVDNVSKCVFNGSDLGKAYSAAAVQSRLSGQAAKNRVDKDDAKSVGAAGVSTKQQKPQELQLKKGSGQQQINPVLDALLSAKEQYDNVPANLLNKKRKKKKRNDKL